MNALRGTCRGLGILLALVEARLAPPVRLGDLFQPDAVEMMLPVAACAEDEG